MRVFAVALLAVAALVFGAGAPSQGASKIQDGSRPQPDGELKSLLDSVLGAAAKTRLERIRKTRRPPAAVAAGFLEIAARAEDLERRVAILHLVGQIIVEFGHEMTPGGAKVARALLGFVDAEGRKQLKIGAAIRNPMKRVEPSAAIALGALAPYLDEEREAAQKALETEVRRFYGFHIADLLRAYYRSYVDAGAPPKELAELLAHDVPYVRETAAEALGAHGHDARVAIDALAEAVTSRHPQKIHLKLGGWSGQSTRDWNSRIQDAAARALVRIAPGDKRAHPAHLRIVQHEKNPRVLLTSLRHVGAMGEDGAPALGRLCRLVLDDDARLAAEAVTAIGMIGIHTKAVVRALQKASERQEKAVAVRAAATLRTLQPKVDKTPLPRS